VRCWLRIPFVRSIGVVLLVAYMFGAIVCHFVFLGDPFSSIMNLGLILAIFAAGRQRSRKMKVLPLYSCADDGSNSTRQLYDASAGWIVTLRRARLNQSLVFLLRLCWQ
jgi:hypothetical protein